MVWYRDVINFLKKLDSAFIDEELRKGIGGYVVDTSILGVIFNKREDIVKKYGRLLDENPVTIYREILEEILGLMFDRLGFLIIQRRDGLIKLLNRENVRIVSKRCDDWKKIIRNLYYDPAMIEVVEKNVGENDAKILAQTLFEEAILLTKDEYLNIIWRRYFNQQKKPKFKNWKDGMWQYFLSNKIKEKEKFISPQQGED